MEGVENNIPANNVYFILRQLYTKHINTDLATGVKYSNEEVIMKILIADDNPDDRILAIRELKKEFRDFEVKEVLSEKDLVEALENFDFNAVITDYRLRWGTGFDVLAKIRELYPYTPIILLTFTGDEEIAVSAIKAGFDDYVLKSKKHIVKLPLAVKNAIEKKKHEVELIKSYERLTESEKKYRELWENANDMLYIHDLEGNFLEANRMALETFGYSKDEITEHNIADILDSEYVDVVMRMLNEIVETKKPTETFEVLCRTKDGREIWAEVRARPILKNGEIAAIQGIARDVTERKTHEREIERLNRILKLVNEINNLIVRERELEDLLSKTAELLSEQYCSAYIGMISEGRMRFYLSELDNSECVRIAINEKRYIDLLPGEHPENCPLIELHGELYALTIPMMVDDSVKGVLVVHSEREFMEDEREMLIILSGDLAFAVRAHEVFEERKKAYEQIERNIEQFAFLIDKIRNPLTAIVLISERVPEEEREKIHENIERINHILRELDRGWVESELIREFLRKSFESE